MSTFFVIHLCFGLWKNQESRKLLVPPLLSSIVILHHLHLIVIVVVFTFIVIMRMSINSIVGFVSKGTLLLTGALCLHSLPASLLFRPISYFRSSNRTSQVRTRINIGEKNAELVCLEAEVDVSVDSQQHVTARNKRSPAMHESAKHEEYELSLSQSSEGCAKIRGPLQCTENEKESDTDNGKLTPEVIEEGSFQNGNCDASFLSSHDDNHDDASYSKCMDADTETPLLCDNKPTVINVKSSAGSADGQQKLKDGVQAKQTFDSNNALDSKTLESGPTAVVTRPRCIQSPLDFSLFRRPVFRLLFSCFILFPTVNIAVAYLPVVAREKDISETDVAKLLSIIGGLDLFSRLGSGIFADRKFVRVSTMVVISFVALGVTYHCVRFLTSFSSFVALAVMQGLLGSVVNCMIPVLIVDHVGLENMAKGIGFYQVAAGCFIAGIHPLLGKTPLITPPPPAPPPKTAVDAGTRFCQTVVSVRDLKKQKRSAWEVCSV